MPKKSKASSRSQKTKTRPASSRVYPYRAITAGASLMPVISLALRGPSRVDVPILGLVDSGADYSVLPLGLTSLLGIDIGQCQQIEGHSAGGHTDYFIWAKPLRTKLLGRDIQLKATFGNTPVALLGREDFFANFKVSFDQRKKRFRLDAY